jgi:microcystin degradation protein MlrC
MMRVLIAGFQHETNTFAPSKADWAAFTRGDDFPAFITGAAMQQAMTGINIAIAGFIDYAETQGWQLKPSAWAGATPSAHVTEDAFEKISNAITSDARALDFDAIYLDLHGAAVAEHLDDCEGELLARLRAIVGPSMPIVVSLDSHANVTEQMIQLSDALTCYRTYPHIDMADTGKRAGLLLNERLKRGTRQLVSFKRVPFIIALNAQSTMTEPNASFTKRLVSHDDVEKSSVNFATGFPAADFAECGPTLWAYGEQAHAVVQKFYDDLMTHRADWRVVVQPAAQAVQRAIELAQLDNTGPVIIADTQDNPGAGADSNTTGMLHALLDAGAGLKFPQQVAIGLISDPQTALAAHQAGVGAVLHIGIGKSVDTGWQGTSEPPVVRDWTVKKISDGVLTLEGPMMSGLTVHLGPCATLEAEGIQVCVMSGKKQMLDKEMYRFLGVQPEQMKILVNKSSVHFRAAFAPIASHILVAKARGPMAANPADFPWKHLPANVDRQP